MWLDWKYLLLIFTWLLSNQISNKVINKHKCIGGDIFAHLSRYTMYIMPLLLEENSCSSVSYLRYCMYIFIKDFSNMLFYHTFFLFFLAILHHPISFSISKHTLGVLWYILLLGSSYTPSPISSWTRPVMVILCALKAYCFATILIFEVNTVLFVQGLF